MKRLGVLTLGLSVSIALSGAPAAFARPHVPGARGCCRVQAGEVVQVELANDEGFVDIVERGFDAGIRMGESVHKDMVAVPLGGPVTVAVVASPAYLQRFPAPRHPDDLARHNCVRFRFAGTGAIYKWEFQVDGRMVDYEIAGNLTISDSIFSVEAALDGIGLAYTFAVA